MVFILFRNDSNILSASLVYIMPLDTPLVISRLVNVRLFNSVEPFFNETDLVEGHIGMVSIRMNIFHHSIREIILLEK